MRERPYNYVHHDQQITAIGREDERAPGLKKEMTLASLRAARYVLRYSRSKKVRYAVRYIQEPDTDRPFHFLRTQKRLGKLSVAAALSSPQDGSENSPLKFLGPPLFAGAVFLSASFCCPRRDFFINYGLDSFVHPDHKSKEELCGARHSEISPCGQSLFVAAPTGVPSRKRAVFPPHRQEGDLQ